LSYISVFDGRVVDYAVPTVKARGCVTGPERAGGGLADAVMEKYLGIDYLKL
jgi:hypothetical protein